MSTAVRSNHNEVYYFAKKVSGLGGPSSPHFPKYFPHYANNTSAHGTGECGTLGKSESPDKLQSTNRCTHTEMETIERQRHEVIALINVLYPRRGLLNHQWHVVRTVRAFCFFTLMGCFDQRLLGSSEEQGCGKRQLAGLEEPFREPGTKMGRGIRRTELVLNRITDLDSFPPSNSHLT